MHCSGRESTKKIADTCLSPSYIAEVSMVTVYSHLEKGL